MVPVEKILLEYLPLVTTPLSLVAFLAAVVVMLHARAVGRAESLIKAAPEDTRATLVSGALQILNVPVKDLSRAQRFELAVEMLAQRKHRNQLVFMIFLVVAVLLSVLTLYAISRPSVDRDVASLLSEDNKPIAMPLLNNNGIFEATDKGVVDYLVSRTSIPQEERQRLSELEFNQAARARYDSIASVRELRQRAEQRLEPFLPLGETVVASVPSRVHQPRQFFVNVPFGSKLADRPVKIISLSTGNYLVAFARTGIDPTNTRTTIHLNREQATYLEGAFPLKGIFDVSIRESVEDIYDPNCSVAERGEHALVPTELCSKGETVTLPYLISILKR